MALRAGANVLESLDWNVADPKALQAKAGAAALEKAKAIAEQMAKGLNAKLGDLVYASNRAPIPMFGGVFRNRRGECYSGTSSSPATPLTAISQKSEIRSHGLCRICN
jgi:hypothetical protein